MWINSKTWNRTLDRIQDLENKVTHLEADQYNARERERNQTTLARRAAQSTEPYEPPREMITFDHGDSKTQRVSSVSVSVQSLLVAILEHLGLRVLPNAPQPVFRLERTTPPPMTKP